MVQVIIRFCDSACDDTSGAAHATTDLMGSIFLVLDHVSHRASQFDVIFNKILDIQQQLLRTAPNMVKAYFPPTIKFVVDMFEVTGNAHCIEYIACAVEVFGSSRAAAFSDLLNHVAGIVHGSFQQQGPVESSPLVQAYFEMNQRFLIYCPSGLVACQQFPGILSCAVECLPACQGEHGRRG